MLTTFTFMNIFLRSPVIYQAELYIGLAIFFIFYLFMMSLCKKYFFRHALDLFIDFVEVFRHLLIILNRKRGREENDN
ncbi:unnamed protein product [Protopolystoma xenopodis]|uniref:Uncharacterized protein n=1 Tax=Protopolystoma xenopodis TaxID=117903 RepID=A0A3S5CNA4_9PLAT|nr:unnamed protein product [Protopolystoma xenopodis]